MDTLRCFIAIEMPQKVKETLVAVQNAIRSELERADPSNVAARSLKWVNPEGIHLTLKFLGAVPTDKVIAIEDGLRKACASQTFMTVQLGKTGAFPSTQRARVVWIGLEGEVEKLSLLQRQVELEMSRLGYEPEARPFSPHLTLARVRDDASTDARRHLGEALTRVSPHAPVSLTVDAVSLMRSQLSPAGARYTRLALIPLPRL